MKRIIGVALLACIAASEAQAQDIVTADDPSDIYTWGGVESFHDWGQTFQSTLAEAYLESFSFWLSETHVAGSYTFAIHEWNGADRTGAALFAEDRSFGTVATSPTWLRHDFDVGGLWLDPSRVYMASLRITEGTSAGVIYFGLVYPGPTNGVPGVYHRDHGDNWSIYTEQSYDAAYMADFSSGVPTEVVPEPITMVLLGSGLAGVGAVGRRRREPATTA